jgi:hypothetical protein
MEQSFNSLQAQREACQTLHPVACGKEWEALPLSSVASCGSKRSTSDPRCNRAGSRTGRAGHPACEALCPSRAGPAHPSGKSYRPGRCVPPAEEHRKHPCVERLSSVVKSTLERVEISPSKVDFQTDRAKPRSALLGQYEAEWPSNELAQLAVGSFRTARPVASFNREPSPREIQTHCLLCSEGIEQRDTWLSQNVPLIRNWQAYKSGQQAAQPSAADSDQAPAQLPQPN